MKYSTLLALVFAVACAAPSTLDSAADSGAADSGNADVSVSDGGAPDASCGTDGGECCTDGSCQAGLGCAGCVPLGRRCSPCGGDGDPCCADAGCESGLSCKLTVDCGRLCGAP